VVVGGLGGIGRVGSGVGGKLFVVVCEGVEGDEGGFGSGGRLGCESEGCEKTRRREEKVEG